MSLTDYIKTFDVNNLHGRMLFIENKQKLVHKRNILLIYGHHSSLERMFGIAEDLSQYGDLTMPDLPGFGGMDSFYKIGLKPSLDNMADYLAGFIKLKLKNKKLTIIAMSYGFLVATRMLQKHPALIKNVEILISVVGFCHKDDFKFSKKRHNAYVNAAKFFSLPATAAFFKNAVLNPTILKTFYSKTYNAKNKFKGLSANQAKIAMEFEVYLWRCNDVRTYMYTSVEMLNVDNCFKRVAMDVNHICLDKDQYFNHSIVEQHMRIIFGNYHEHTATMDKHAPSIIATKDDSKELIPDSIRKLLLNKV